MEKRKLPYELKQLVKQRDNFRCSVEDCLSRNDQGTELNIHHVLPEKYGGSDKPSNLITLCVPHHKMMHIDFHAYYPDGLRAVRKMNYYLKQFATKIESAVKFGEFYDYKAPLEYLTGHRTFRGGQADVFRAVRRGKDVLFVAPTGVGKSITFQLPGLLSPHSTLVISPLKSLMKDQVQQLWQKYIPSTYVNGDVGPQDSRNRISMIQNGLMKFVYVAPERFFKSPKSRGIFLQKYDLFVVDEAHCIDKWGGHFRQSYGSLEVMRKELGFPQTIAVTASASRSTQDEIIRSLGLQKPVRIVKGFYRPNIEIINNLHMHAKDDQLRDVAQNYLPKSGKTLFYVATLKEGELLRQKLLVYKPEVSFYHGQLSAEDKSTIQDRFSGIRKNDEINIIIATSAFGMGINIPNIRLVVHWNIPGSIEDYYQQIGRAGRDGKPSRAILLYASGDEGLARYIAQASIRSNHSLSEEEQNRFEEKIEEDIQAMKGVVNAKSPWGYILSYFGDQGFLSNIAKIWQFLGQVAATISQLIRRIN